MAGLEFLDPSVAGRASKDEKDSGDATGGQNVVEPDDSEEGLQAKKVEVMLGVKKKKAMNLERK